MRRSIMITAIALVSLIHGATNAQEQTLYGGCTDAGGQQVSAVPDAELPAAIATRLEDGTPVIRYNHAHLTRLNDKARLFLYAHECSRLNLGDTPEQPRSQASARKADCWAAATLLRSGLITVDDLEPLQKTLAFSAAEWRQLPGPVRRIDLRSCPRHLSPSLHVPDAGQDDWNTCTRRCADTSLACQQTGKSGSCNTDYDACVARCDADVPR